MKGCVACEAFPRHRGAHYTARDVTALLFSQRVRSVGRTRWMPLPGSFTPAGRQILVSTHMSEDPDARSVAGIWLLEEKGTLQTEELAAPGKAATKATPVPNTPIPPRAPAQTEEAPGEAEAPAEVPETEAEPETPSAAPPNEAVPAAPAVAEPVAVSEATAVPVPPEPRTTGSLPKEDIGMAGTRGYLSWAINGLDVDIRALPGSGASPSVEQLKAALKSFRTEDGVMARLTETLSDNEAWITLSAPPGQQGKLLISTGQIVDLLVQGGVYEEVLLAHV